MSRRYRSRTPKRSVGPRPLAPALCPGDAIPGRVSRFSLLAASLLALGVTAQVPSARPPAAAAVSCRLSGEAQPAPDTLIFDAPQGGSPVARFTGAPSTLLTTAFPADASAQRVAVLTGTGTGSFRVDGYVNAAELPLFTTSELPVAGPRLKIGAQQEVRAARAAGSRLEVMKQLVRPRQTFRAWTACGNLSLLRGTPKPWAVPGSARGYVVDVDELELREGPGTDAPLVTTLSLATGMLLWSVERRAPWVHLEYHGEIIIDAWAHERDLRALPPGETQDELKPPPPRSRTPRLALKDVPREVRTSREVRLRLGGSESAKSVGVIEPGTDVFVLDIVAGWASVLPKSLHVAPHGDGQFWVLASELGLGK